LPLRLATDETPRSHPLDFLLALLALLVLAFFVQVAVQVVGRGTMQTGLGVPPSEQTDAPRSGDSN
jgi:hypothetical protein